MRMRIIWSSLVGANHKSGDKLIGKAVEITAVEFRA
jgi:hypothetical protein